MPNAGAKRNGPRMPLELNQEYDIRPIMLLLQLFKRRIGMIEIEESERKTIRDFMIPPNRRCLQPKEIEGIFSAGFLLIPLVAPHDQLPDFNIPEQRLI